jgi:hypothetical protein
VYQESKAKFGAFCVLTLGVAGTWIAMFACPLYQYVFHAWPVRVPPFPLVYLVR